jgi:hypothetical protein
MTVQVADNVAREMVLHLTTFSPTTVRQQEDLAGTYTLGGLKQMLSDFFSGETVSDLQRLGVSSSGSIVATEDQRITSTEVRVLAQVNWVTMRSGENLRPVTVSVTLMVEDSQTGPRVASLTMRGADTTTG